MKDQVLGLVAGALAIGWMIGGPAQASTIHFGAALGPEVAGATGSGSVLVTYDDVTNAILIEADWSGLSGVTTVSHIHCCTATAGTGTVGVAVTPGTLPGFPTGVSAGSYSILLDLDDPSVFTSGFITNFAGGLVAAADEAFLAGLYAGTAYFNIHTTTFPGGEIRGFLQQSVPEPGSLALLGLGLAGLGLSRRRKLR